MPEVCKFHDIIIVLDKDIQRLDVSVKDILLVNMLYRLNEFLEVESSILLIQNSAAVQQVIQSTDLRMLKDLVYH